MKGMVTIIGLVVILTGISIGYAQETSKNDTALLSADKILDDARSQITEISTSDLKSVTESGDSFLLIDVRTEREYLAGHLEGAVWIPRGKIEFAIQKLTKDPQQRMILYCRSGGRGALATSSLVDMGFENVLSLNGGFKAWVADGNSVFNRHGEIKVVAFEKEEVVNSATEKK